MVEAYRIHLDAIFFHAEERMWDLSVGSEGYFTNYEFIRRATQDAQAAYIRFLAAVLERNYDEDEERPRLFGIAHGVLGTHIRILAQELGYEKETDSEVDEWNIWGDKEKAVLYHRTERVQQPR